MPYKYWQFVVSSVFIPKQTYVTNYTRYASWFYCEWHDVKSFMHHIVYTQVRNMSLVYVSVSMKFHRWVTTNLLTRNVPGLQTSAKTGRLTEKTNVVFCFAKLVVYDICIVEHLTIFPISGTNTRFSSKTSEILRGFFEILFRMVLEWFPSYMVA